MCAGQIDWKNLIFPVPWSVARKHHYNVAIMNRILKLLTAIFSILSSNTCNGFMVRVAPLGVAPSCPAKNWVGLGKPQQGLLAKRNSNDNDGVEDPNILITMTDSILQVASTPTPGISNLPLGYPLALATTAIFLPVTTSLQLAITFAFFSILVRRIILEDEDDDEEEDFPVNFVVAVGSVLTTGLLTVPSQASAISSMNATVPIVGIALILLTAIILQQAPSGVEPAAQDDELPSIEKQRMDLWDSELEKSTTKTRTKKRE
jgi:hypothetical protein